MSFGGYRGGYGGYGLGGLLNQQEGFSAGNIIGEAMSLGSNYQQQQANDQQQQANTELSRYQLQGAKMQSDLERMTYNDAMIAHAARTAQGDPDQWDKNFQTLDEQGVPGARQWIGRYSPAAMDAIDRGYDPQSPLARATRPAGSRGGSAPDGEDTDYDRLFAQTPAAQIPQIADRTGRAMDLLASVKDAATWEAAKAQAGKLGLQGVQNLGSYSPLKVQVLYEHLLGVHNYLAGRTADQGLGIPAPNVASKTASVGDTLYSINEETPTGVAEATPIAHVPESQFVGIDPKTGHAIYHDTRPVAGQGPSETQGIYDVQPKGARGNTFDSKQQAWLAVHPGDQQGALDFAGGRGGKQMSPEDITKSALQLATSDLHSAIGAGAQIDDPRGFVEQRRQQYERDISQQNAPPAGAGGGNQRRQQYDRNASIAAARAAIKAGKDRNAVIARLKANGISTAGL